MNENQIVQELPYKDVSFDKEKMINGIETLYRAVSSTLGAQGSTVFIETDGGFPYITKDGVTVARNIIPKDPIERLGAFVVYQAAKRTADTAGDGTTTSTVLAHAIITKVLKEKNAVESYKRRDIVEGIDRALKNIVSILGREIRELKEEDYEDIASISTNNDKELGKIIADVFKEVGKKGAVNWVEDRSSDKITVDVVQGSKVPASVINEGFLTKGHVCDFKDPLILLTSMQIPTAKSIQHILEYAHKNERPILIMAPIEEGVKKALLKNKEQNKLQVCVLNTPYAGNYGSDIMRDLAYMTGGTFHSDSAGDDPSAITIESLGTAQKSVSDSMGTVFFFGEDIDANERVDEIKEMQKTETNVMNKGLLVERLSILQGGIGTIKVGAHTDVARMELLDRVEDAVRAVGSAIEGGILPGGGSALRSTAIELFGRLKDAKAKNGNDFGYLVMLSSIMEPFKVIMRNAGLQEDGWSLKKNQGIDVLTGKKRRMYDAGIIDPAKVTIQALINATSVAKTILMTDAIITNKRD